MSGNAKVREVADHLSVHPETVRIMTREGVFPGAFKLGTKPAAQVRIPWQDVFDYEKTQPRVSA
jgi:hypothetical protein